MDQISTNLLQALVELENAVRTMPSQQPKPNLLPLFSRIDQLTAQLPQGTDPRLLHFLQRKSYTKARRWLEGDRSELA